MEDAQKSNLIGLIIGQLRLEAQRSNKAFDAGDTAFALAFRSDDELLHISRLCGIDIHDLSAARQGA